MNISVRECWCRGIRPLIMNGNGARASGARAKACKHNKEPGKSRLTKKAWITNVHGVCQDHHGDSASSMADTIKVFFADIVPVITHG